MRGVQFPTKQREFLRSAFSEWGSAVTGGISAPLFLWAIFFSASEWLRFAGMTTAAACVYFSAYRVWKREREARESVEAQLYSDAMMQGSAVVEIGGYNPFEDQTRPGCFFKVSVEAHNTGRTPCTIGEIRIVVRPPDGIFVPLFIVSYDLEPEKVGYGDYFRCATASITQPGMLPNELRQSKLQVLLLDGTQQEHAMIDTSISPRILDRTI
jgi:hypothetical protein